MALDENRLDENLAHAIVNTATITFGYWGKLSQLGKFAPFQLLKWELKNIFIDNIVIS